MKVSKNHRQLPNSIPNSYMVSRNGDLHSLQHHPRKVSWRLAWKTSLSSWVKYWSTPSPLTTLVRLPTMSMSLSGKRLLVNTLLSFRATVNLSRYTWTFVDQRSLYNSHFTVSVSVCCDVRNRSDVTHCGESTIYAGSFYSLFYICRNHETFQVPWPALISKDEARGSSSFEFDETASSLTSLIPG